MLLSHFRDIYRNQNDVVLELPARRTTGLLIVRRDPILHQRRFPFVRDDQWPQKKQPLPRIYKHSRIRLRKSRGICQGERLAPLMSQFVPSSCLYQHLVGGFFYVAWDTAHHVTVISPTH